MKQSEFFKKQKSAYGGDLLTTRKARARPRPLCTRNTMHLVLRSTKAKGEWSFKKPSNERKIEALLKKFSLRYGVKVISLANVGNHLHFQIKLSNRFTYRPFIRALTASIAMAVTGSSRWKPLYKSGAHPSQNKTARGAPKVNKEDKAANVNDESGSDQSATGAARKNAKTRFWDYRPFTRIVESFRAVLNLRDYIRINQLEGYGYRRDQARWIIAQGSLGWNTS